MKNFKTILKFFLFITIGIFLVWWSLKQIPSGKWSEFKTALKTARYWLFFPVAIFLLLSHFLRSLRWKLLMEPLGFFPRIPNVFFAVMIGYLANLALPRLGEILKCTILARYEKVPVDKLAGTIIAERAFDLICLLLLFLITLFLQYDIVVAGFSKLLQQTFVTQQGNLSISKALFLLVLIIAGLLIIYFIFSRFAHINFIKKIKQIIKGIWQGLISVKNLKRKTPFFIYTFSIWFLYLISTWAGFYATEGTNHLGIATACSALFFGSVGMIITPGGIGAYAYLIAKILEENNIPYALAYANGTLQWFAQFLLVIIVGIICVILIPWYNNKKIHEAS
ncbi:MAG: lysylphosphatidylglycerol synthase transmembrane domain-containing protein [Chitinophagaceae bacterium]